jgi:two-component system, NarL family, nitrate/nitrite response regulator NarL
VTEVIPGNPIRLVILGDPSLFRAGLACIIAAEPGLEVSGECTGLDEALEAARRSAVDVLLLDFDVSTRPVSKLIFAARQSGYKGRFLVVTGMLDTREFALVLKHGLAGIFLKSEPPSRLIEAIRAVAHGDTWVDQKVIQLIADHLIENPPPANIRTVYEPLDEDERKVLVGILGGLSNRKIGESTELSESSVKNMVQRLFRKAGVRSRSQLVRVALGGSAGRGLSKDLTVPARLR